MNIHFTKGGMSLIVTDLSDIIRGDLKRVSPSEIIINTSSQPNSKPHLGTLTTLMTAFLLAEKFKKDFKIPTIVRFDELENSPFQVFDEYYISLGNAKDENGVSIAEKNMMAYINIFEKLKRLTKIPYEIRSYKEFQSNNIIRENLITILKNKEIYDKFLNPSNISTYVRTECPLCYTAFAKPIMKLENNLVTFYGRCPKHGDYKVVLKNNNNDYVDINTQLRDILKGVHILKQQNESVYEIMCDGSDWSGEWASNVHYRTMLQLGYNYITPRFFTPTIVDESGGKFSKSIYLSNGSYSGDEKLFADYILFNEKYGEKGWKKLYNEVKNWVNEPMRFFRSYSWQYIKHILEEV